jgi:hypothetical protein
MYITTFLGLLLAGCSADYDMSKEVDAAFDDTAGAADTDADETGDVDTEPALEPAWYVVRASLSVVDGVASASDATVAVEVIDADLERVDCTVPLDTAAVVAGPADPDVLWWDLRVDPLEAPCAPLPATLSLGVGTLHPDARARLGAVGYDAVADSLFGAWIRPDDGEAAAYGYAGTEADLTGDDPAVFPPPDGRYALAPLYVLALPAE